MGVCFGVLLIAGFVWVIMLIMRLFCVVGLFVFIVVYSVDFVWWLYCTLHCI